MFQSNFTSAEIGKFICENVQMTFNSIPFVTRDKVGNQVKEDYHGL